MLQLLKGTILTHQIYQTGQVLSNFLSQNENLASYFYSQIMYFEDCINKKDILIDCLKQAQNIPLLMDILDQFYISLLIEANLIFKNQIALEQQLQSLIQKCLRRLVKKHSKSELYNQIQRKLKDSYNQREKEILEEYQSFYNSGNLNQVYDKIYLHTKKIFQQFQKQTNPLSIVFTAKYYKNLVNLIQIQTNPIIIRKLKNPPIIKANCIQQLKYYLQNQQLNWEYTRQPSDLIQHLLVIILSIEFKLEELLIVFELIQQLGNKFQKSKEIGFMIDKCFYLAQSIKDQNQLSLDKDYLFQTQVENQKQYNFLQKLNEQYNSDQFWETQISEEENLRTIINIIIQLSGFKFIEKNQFSIDRYQPECRSIMIKIANRLQNKKYNYLNISIIQTMEELFGKLQLDLLNQINQYIGMNDKVSKLQFQFQCQLSENIIIPLNLQIGDLQMYSSKFQLLTSLQHPFQQFDLKTIKQNCCQLIEEQIDQIYNYYVHKTIAKPIFMFFQQVSPISQPSNVITICISGFTSEDECKAKKWEQLAKSTKSHVIGLNFQNCHVFKIAVDVGLAIAGLFIAPEALVATLVCKYFSNNFTDAENEAERVGVYLGYLIGYCQIFGNSLINLVGFSLGTVVIQKCIETLDKIHKECGSRFLNDVLLMGGAADLEQLKNCNLESINGRLINVYSKNDQVLKYLHKFLKQGNPCGLYKLHNISPKIQNYDMTHMIDGHSSYQKNYEELLKLVGFDQDINV